MVGPNWSDDDLADEARIIANVGAALTAARRAAEQREVLTAAHLLRWHTMVYSGCSVPSPSYIGNFRGDASHSELVDYDVIVGDRPGVPAEDVDAAVAAFFESAADALAKLDRHFPPGAVPTTAEDVKEIVIVAAVIHGEWVRIHPFANGNGRTARLLANYVALRYGLPAFVRLKPRPDGVQHAHASKTSMDRPQDIVGDHGATYFVFLHMLRSTLEDGSS